MKPHDQTIGAFYSTKLTAFPQSFISSNTVPPLQSSQLRSICPWPGAEDPSFSQIFSITLAPARSFVTRCLKLVGYWAKPRTRQYWTPSSNAILSSKLSFPVRRHYHEIRFTNRLVGLNSNTPLNQWILGDFPTQPNTLLSSFSWRLLWRLSNTICFRNILDPKSKTMDVVTRYDRMVNAAPHILEFFLDSTFEKGYAYVHSSTWTQGRSSDLAAADQQGSERGGVNSILSSDFSIRTPTNAHEKAEAIRSVFNVLKSVLQVRPFAIPIQRSTHFL